MRLAIAVAGFLAVTVAYCVTRDASAHVVTGTVKRGRLVRWVHLVGPLMPRHHAVVLPKMPGRAALIHVTQGDVVKKDQALVTLDAEDLQIEHDRRLLELRKARIRLSTAPARTPIDLHRIEVREAELALRKARSQLNDSVLRSSIDGHVVQLGVRPGDFMASNRITNGEGIIVAATSELVVRAEADEFASAQIRRGATARVTLDAYPSLEFRGTVASEPLLRRTSTESNKGAVFEVTVEVRDAGNSAARIGVTANVAVEVVARADVLQVPLAAIVHVNGGAFALVREGRRYRRTPITLGDSDHRVVEILAGVSEGATVAIGSSSELLRLGPGE